MGVKVYISGISGNKEVKKRQQRVLMILESRNIAYSVVDITEPGRESDRDFMQEKSTSLGATVSDLKPRHPLPPQLFNEDEYCGDYDQFDMANEIDELEVFLKVAPPGENKVSNAEVILGNGTGEPEVDSTEPEPVVESSEPETSKPEAEAEPAEPEPEEVESSEPEVESSDLPAEPSELPEETSDAEDAEDEA